MSINTMMSISGTSIEIGPLPFNIHIVDSRGHMVLYGRRGVVITPELKESILRQNRVFYVSGNEIDSFLDYALDNMSRIVRDRTVNTRVKTSIIKDVGQKIFRKIESEGLCDSSVEHSRQFTRAITDLIIGSPDAYHGLLTLATEKSYSYDHAVNTCTFCILMGQRLWGEDEAMIFQFGLGGLLMNIGMTGIDEKILNKPGPLNPEEMLAIQRHTESGYENLKEQEMPTMVLDMARWHHERMDGSGYPDRLSGDRIPVHVQYAVVCDVYDSLTSIRSFRKQLPPLAAIQEMFKYKEQYSLPALEMLMHIVLKNESLVQGLLTRFN